MIKKIFICDKCGHEETVEGEYCSNKNYGKVEVKLSQYNKKEFLLCNKCQKDIGIIVENNNGSTTQQRIDTIGDRLFEVMSEIVETNMEER